jgi:hypothetical protein
MKESTIKRGMKKLKAYLLKIIFSFMLFLSAIIVYPQADSNTFIYEPFHKLSVKISYLLLEGEVPLTFEYRVNERIGHEFSFAYTYLNIEPGSKRFFGNGYKIKYGLRFYISSKKRENRWWFINPQIFYKQMWINDRYYNSDYFIFGSGGHEDNDIYQYNENRKVIALELLSGFVERFKKISVEFVFGIGVRYIGSNNKITDWHHMSGYGWFRPIPIDAPTNSSWEKVYPSIQLGGNISIPIIKSK